MQIGAVVALTDLEQQLAELVATARQARNRSAGVVDQQVSATRALDIERTGIGAELAWCRLANCYPDLTIQPRKGGADAIWRGVSVDVKGTERTDGQLLAHPTKLTRDGAALYALMTGPWPSYTFRGFATADDLLAPARLTNLGYGRVYAVPQSELRA